MITRFASALLMIALGCGGSAPAAAMEDDVLFQGMCDASALAVVDGRWLVVADDEHDQMQVYDASRGGSPVHHIDLTGVLGMGDGRESDLEAAATVGDRTWWIGSHGRSRRGKRRPGRQVLVATRMEGHDGGVRLEVEGAPVRSLLPAMLASPEAGVALTAAEPYAPKAAGGLNIEGLSAGPDGALYIGFRSPAPRDRALVLRLDKPDALLTGKDPGPMTGFRLDLGGRGVRSMDWDAARSRFLIVAGPIAKKGGFALYSWDGADGVRRLDAGLKGLNVEALHLLDGRMLVLSDDGSVERDGVACKDQPASARSFRGRWLPLP